MNSLLAGFINAFLLSVPLTLAVWLALRWAPRAWVNAATRYWIWWSLLIAVILLPGARVVRLPSLAAARESARVSAPISVFPQQPLPVAAPMTSAPAVKLFPVRIETGAWAAWAIRAWALLSATMLLRLVASLLMLHRLARGPDIQLSSDAAIPMAIGPFRRAILIPRHLSEQLTEDEIRTVVLHESAHLARHDDIALLLQRVLEALYAPHVMVRWITRQIDLEREIACDDLVIAQTGRAREYAACLAKVAAGLGDVRSSRLASAAVSDRSVLARRIGALLEAKRAGARLSLRWLAAGLAMVAASGGVAVRGPAFVAFSAISISRTTPSPIAIEPPPPTVPSPKRNASPEYLAQARPPALPPPQPAAPAVYVIQAGDVLSIVVLREPDFTRQLAVAADGTIVFPLVGPVAAAGRTVEELRTELTSKLDGIIVAPQVSVAVLQIGTQLAEVPLTVRDPQGRYVSGLTVDNFAVEDDAPRTIEQVIDLDSRPHAYAVVLPPGIDFAVVDGMRQRIGPEDSVFVTVHSAGTNPFVAANAMLRDATQPRKFLLAVDASPPVPGARLVVKDLAQVGRTPLTAALRSLDELRDELSRLVALLQRESGYLLRYRTSSSVGASPIQVRIVRTFGLPPLTVQHPIFATAR